MTQRIVAGVQLASRALGVLAALVIFVMLLANVVDILLRTAVGTPVPGVFEYSEVALVAMVFLGLPYTMQTGGHVAIDSITSRLPSSWRRYVEALALIAVLPFVVWLAEASVGVAIESFVQNEVKFGVIEAPVWPARMMIPIGAALLAAEIVIAIVRTLRGDEPARSDGQPVEGV